MGKDSQIIRGILVPSGWDAEGRVIEVAISTYDEKIYFVEKESLNASLLSKLQKKIVVNGVISEKDGKNLISVQGMNPKGVPDIATEGKDKKIWKRRG